MWTRIYGKKLYKLDEVFQSKKLVTGAAFAYQGKRTVALIQMGNPKEENSNFSIYKCGRKKKKKGGGQTVTRYDSYIRLFQN